MRKLRELGGFIVRIVERGLRGLQMVTSDAHRGLEAAIQTIFVGNSWQRCTIHVMRNLLSHVSHRDKRAVAALARTVLAQPTIADAQRQLAAVLPELERRWGKKCAAVLRNAENIFFHIWLSRLITIFASAQPIW